MSYSSYSPRSPSSSQPRSRGTGGSSYGYNTRLPFTSTSYGSGTSASSYIKKDLGTLVQAFQRPSGTVSPVRITSVKPISSYSWIEAGSKPTILVPGSPPVWTNTNPRRVPQDQGLTYIDQNSARMGPKASPLTPIFASIEELGADVDLQTFDIVTDRNNLRKLLRWATGAIDEKDFRIDVELAGKTCLFTRREEKDSENVTEFRGFGHEYEKAATRWPKGSERATGHHRVISINLGGIKVLLRFEIDACTQTVPNDPSADVDDLATALAGLSTGASTSQKTSSFKTLDIRPSGNRTLVPQSTLIELKTRAAHKALDMDETAPQLYLSQTPYLYLAKHVKGNFQTVERIQPDANRVEGQLGKLRETLLDILETVREQGSGVGLCLVCAGRKLELYERKPGTGRAVGPEILSKFGNQQEDDDD